MHAYTLYRVNHIERELNDDLKLFFVTSVKESRCRNYYKVLQKYIEWYAIEKNLILSAGNDKCKKNTDQILYNRF